MLAVGVALLVVELCFEDIDNQVSGCLGRLCCCCARRPSEDLADDPKAAARVSARAKFLRMKRKLSVVVQPAVGAEGDAAAAGRRGGRAHRMLSMVAATPTSRQLRQTAMKAGKPTFDVFVPLRLTQRGLLKVDIFRPAIAMGLISGGLSTLSYAGGGWGDDAATVVREALSAAAVLFDAIKVLPIFGYVFFLMASVTRWRSIKTAVFGLQGKIHAFSLTLAGQPWDEWGATEDLWRFYRRLNVMHFLEYRNVALVLKKTSLGDLIKCGLLTPDEVEILCRHPGKELPAVASWLSRAVWKMLRDGRIGQPTANRMHGEIANIQAASAKLHFELSGLPSAPPSHTAFMVLMFRAFVVVITMSIAKDTTADAYCVQVLPVFVTALAIAAFGMLLKIPKILVDPFGTDHDDTDVDSILCTTDKVLWTHMSPWFATSDNERRRIRAVEDCGQDGVRDDLQAIGAATAGPAHAATTDVQGGALGVASPQRRGNRLAPLDTAGHPTQEAAARLFDPAPREMAVRPL